MTIRRRASLLESPQVLLRTCILIVVQKSAPLSVKSQECTVKDRRRLRRAGHCRPTSGRRPCDQAWPSRNKSSSRGVGGPAPLPLLAAPSGAAAAPPPPRPRLLLLLALPLLACAPVLSAGCDCCCACATICNSRPTSNPTSLTVPSAL